MVSSLSCVETNVGAREIVLTMKIYSFVIRPLSTDCFKHSEGIPRLRRDRSIAMQ